LSASTSVCTGTESRWLPGSCICLLNSFVNPAHERTLRDLLVEVLPDLHVTISSDITRELSRIRARLDATLSAYVQPVIDRYIERFRKRLGVPASAAASR